jgi:hypothetical protein
MKKLSKYIVFLTSALALPLLLSYPANADIVSAYNSVQNDSIILSGRGIVSSITTQRFGPHFVIDADKDGRKRCNALNVKYKIGALHGVRFKKTGLINYYESEHYLPPVNGLNPHVFNYLDYIPKIDSNDYELFSVFIWLEKNDGYRIHSTKYSVSWIYP